MKLLIHPEASADIREEANYYEAKQAGLGIAFLQEVDAAVESILATPKAFPRRRKDIRMFILPRFPFSVFYRIDDRNIGGAASCQTA